jgi:hypothetical protein
MGKNRSDGVLVQRISTEQGFSNLPFGKPNAGNHVSLGVMDIVKRGIY